MLERLQNSSPTYNVDKWEADRKQSLHYLDIRSKHPYMFNNKRKRLMSKSIAGNSTSYMSFLPFNRQEQQMGAHKSSSKMFDKKY